MTARQVRPRTETARWNRSSERLHGRGRRSGFHLLSRWLGQTYLHRRNATREVTQLGAHAGYRYEPALVAALLEELTNHRLVCDTGPSDGLDREE